MERDICQKRACPEQLPFTPDKKDVAEQKEVQDYDWNQPPEREGLGSKPP
jgi:hypothetical protein